MEKYFIVKNGTKLYNDYITNSEVKEKINNAFNEFSETNGITSDSYYQDATRLRIELNCNDMKKFGSQIKVNTNGDFKKTSELNKKWVAMCKDKNINSPRRIMIMDYIKCHSYKTSSRLFKLGDTLYGSLDNKTDEEFTLSDDYIELKASEFYKAIEDEKEKEMK